ncbi:endo-alpha-N-acetylgalactosaminidase family protein [Streptomyces scopuliridis]|uniref:endo-alpha-N-acetylgalactosaminidase family protein n=1 Tax=Streptomyces scopuliridis TaxID=452529 RepID=UPI0034499DAF
MRRIPVILAMAVAVGVLGAPPAPAAAPSVPAASVSSPVTISSSELSVEVDPDFPRVIGYQTRDGAQLGGQPRAIDRLQINGKEYKPAVKATPAADRIDYRLTVDELDLTVVARLSVADSVLKFEVTDVEERGSTKVTTLAIPDQSIVSGAPGDQLTSVQTRSTYQGAGDKWDAYQPVSEAKTDETPQKTNVAIVNSSRAAAAVWSSSISSFGPLLRQTTGTGAEKRSGVWSNTWTYRGPDGEKVVPPELKVVVTGESNDDGRVDWQDGAIAYRKIAPKPKGGEDVANTPVSYISMNFMSGAQNPFLRALDNVKKGYLATDGLGQSIQLKGYGGEGHDSAHPDYAGHYNNRAGGLKDLNTLANSAEKYGAKIGVHLSQEGQLLESKAFRWDRLNSTKPCYFWSDAHYCFDKSKDLSGPHAERVKQLKKEVPGLDFVYNDAFFGEDWDAWKLAKNYNDNGLALHTEWPSYLWPYVTWYHQSADYPNNGVNSDILRFVYNGFTDAWVQKGNELLGGVNSDGIGDWHGEHDVNRWLETVYSRNLPTKYLQNFEITNWSDDKIDLSGGVSTAKVDGKVRYTQDGRTILDGDAYLLPWPASKSGKADKAGQADKAYHWNADGGTTSWKVPPTWRQNGSYDLYKLGDTGRKSLGKVEVRDGTVTLTAEAKTPYLLVPQKQKQAPKKVTFGEGGSLANPSFTSGDLTGWKGTDATVGRDERGWPELRVSGTGQATQRSEKLAAGTYTAAVWTTTAPGRRAALTVNGRETWIDTTPPPLKDADSHLSGMPYQKLKVVFTVGKDGRADVKLSAGPGKGSTAFTDVRIVRTDGASPTPFSENFEAVDQGFGPFIQTQAGEAGIHLAEANPGYTRDALRDTFSLKIAEANTGVKLQTWPGSMRFQPGRAYRVRFDYAADTADTFEFLVRSGEKPVLTEPLRATTDRSLDSPPPAGDPKPSDWTDSLPPQGPAPVRSADLAFTTGGCTDVNLALSQISKGKGGDFPPSMSFDNLVVEDLGKAAGSECGAPTSVSFAPDEVAPEGATEATVTVENRSGEPMTGVKVDLTVPEGWRATAGTPTTIDSVPARGKSTVTYQITPAENAKQGVVRTVASYTWNGAKLRTSGEVDVPVVYPGLAEAFDNVGTTDTATAGRGGLDDKGRSFDRSALEAAGLTPGGKKTVDNMEFTWPNTRPGEKDNVSAKGQTIRTTAKGVLGVLGTATAGAAGDLVIRYTDGTTSTAQLGLPAWTSTNRGPYGARAVATTKVRNTPNGPESGDSTVFYNSVPLDPGKTVRSITLPTEANLHVFALSSRDYVTSPKGDVYASDLAWKSASSGWGPIERDHAIGEDKANDGDAIRINGEIYEKGLGAHAPSEAVYDLGGGCSRFTARIGLDDKSGYGTVGFSVIADGKTLYTSPLVQRTTKTIDLDLDLGGAKEVKLVTTDGGDGNSSDHSAWGDAKFRCG